ncbi:BTAD domain-containing putative transcriptional regulator [Streptomyces sp. MB09-01]|uniref:AfsR/SARP family transcriptional regulator n=1 Tax=Streptomyces sp. MB09-01 TaxID=3028666 RepID=UPI00299FECF3|nr:BTAD domain-containing putative transcriptional regulator [Streptomyces sp. MB09-01]MDX3534784.1 BTAD domain-containing putative transcriptional regulator [Streptomyces sp. MB09-01]
MRFGILGPLEVTGGTGPTDTGQVTSYAPQAAKLRVVLGTLLVRANDVVSVESLIDELWPDAPPRTATTTLQVYVSHLRKTLQSADPENGREALVTRRPGYLLRVGADAVDSTAFEDLSRRGHQALQAGDFATAADLQRRALALWRGPVLSDTPHGPVLEGAAVRLAEARTTALDERIRAELHLGLHRELVAELQELVAEHRMHEEFHTHLMVALYRCGRQAEALRVFALLRATLVEELGIEPGPSSSRLQRRILEGDPALSRPRAGTRAEAGTATGPETGTRGAGEAPAGTEGAYGERPAGEGEATGGGAGAPAGRRSAALEALLPAADPCFTARADELTALERMLRSAPAGGCVAVTGMPGAGKTALAVEAAHRVADAFPDGRIFLDLRDTAGPPAEGAQALERLLHRAGGPADPADGRSTAPRVLLILDDVTSETQVRPLLPALRGAVVLLTARRVPAGLPGLRSVVLAPWRPDEAARLAGLFTGRAGTRAVTRGGAPALDPGPVPDPGTVAEIAELCGRLPLAVRTAAAQLAARPHWTAATLADRLRDESGRLDALRTGDVDVRARLLAAYAACPDDQRRAFRLLSLLPPGRFGAREAAAALDVTGPQASAALEALADERLVAADRDGWHLPELLRLLAAERLALEERTGAARAGAERVCRAYAVAAAEPGRGPEQGARGLVRLARTAYDAGLWELTVRLTDALPGGSVQDEGEAAYTLALDAAERCGDRSAQARMLRSLGDLAWQYRRVERAHEVFSGALALARAADDEEEAARALVGLAELRLDAGESAEAAALLEPALAALSAPGRTRGRYEASRARALLALAQEGPETARAWFGECLELAGALRDHRLEVYALRSLRALSTPSGPGAGSGRGAAAARAVEIRPGLWRIRPAGVRA